MVLCCAMLQATLSAGKQWERRMERRRWEGREVLGCDGVKKKVRGRVRIGRVFFFGLFFRLAKSNETITNRPVRANLVSDSVHPTILRTKGHGKVGVGEYG